jgi:hypothetical protein
LADTGAALPAAQRLPLRQQAPGYDAGDPMSSETDASATAARAPARGNGNDNGATPHDRIGDDGSLFAGGDTRASDGEVDTADADDAVIVDSIPYIRPATVLTDPRNAIDPGEYFGTQFLIMENLPPGGLPQGPTTSSRSHLRPPSPLPSSDYLSQACVVCTLLSAGYAVWRTAASTNPLTHTTSDYATRRLLQRGLCQDGYWIVDALGRARHSRHFWVSELRHWTNEAPSQTPDSGDPLSTMAPDHGDPTRTMMLMDTAQTHATLAAAG